MKWVGHVERMERRKMLTVFGGKTERKKVPWKTWTLKE
jgi:hypothetical protein